MRATVSCQIGPEPPEWIRILPLGEVILGDGREPFQVTEASLADILAAWQRRGNDMVIDYEHQTVSGKEAPAAGWVKEMAVGPDGLWVKVEWTERAKDYLTRKEYRYFSPVVEIDENRVVRDLLHVALTNVPAIAKLTPLVLSIQELGVAAAVAAPGGAEPGAVEEFEGKMEEESGKAEGSASTEQLAEQGRHWAEVQKELEELRAEVKRLQRQLRQERAQQLVQEALRSGRTTPAELAQGGGRLRQLAVEEPEFFRELIMTRAPYSAIPGPLAWQEEEEADLSPTEREICRQLGVKIENYKYIKSLLEEQTTGSERG